MARLAVKQARVNTSRVYPLSAPTLSAQPLALPVMSDNSRLVGRPVRTTKRQRAINGRRAQTTVQVAGKPRTILA